MNNQNKSIEKLIDHYSSKLGNDTYQELYKFVFWEIMKSLKHQLALHTILKHLSIVDVSAYLRNVRSALHTSITTLSNKNLLEGYRMFDPKLDGNEERNEALIICTHKLMNGCKSNNDFVVRDLYEKVSQYLSETDCQALDEIVLYAETQLLYISCTTPSSGVIKNE
jgi:hypothetical protein